MNLRGEKKAHLKFLKSMSSRSCPFLPGFKGYFGLGLKFFRFKKLSVPVKMVDKRVSHRVNWFITSLTRASLGEVRYGSPKENNQLG